MTQPTLAQAARLYASAGWPVLPLHHVRDGGCSCKLGPDCRQPGKHPRIPSGFHAATRDPDQVAAWWARWPQANIGIATGVSGLAVVDLDGPTGLATWQHLAAERGPVPSTATAATPHGEHRWYRLPEGLVAPRRIGALGDGIDLLGDGGYAIVPPSTIPCTPPGRTSALQRGLHVARTRAEARTATRLGRPSARTAAGGRPSYPRSGPQAMRRGRLGTSRSVRYGQVALAGEATRVANAPAGRRNDTLNAAAYRLGRHIEARLLTEAEAAQALLDAARASGHITDDGEYTARRTIASGLTAGQRDGRHSPELAAGM